LEEATVAASKKTPKPGKAKPGSPDELTKAGKDGQIELAEDDLKKVSAGMAIKVWDKT
jgi:hypothetical protein